MAAISRSEDESFPGTLQDRCSANEIVVRSQSRQASRGQTRRPRRVAVLPLPMFAVCGQSTNHFAQVLPQRLRLDFHCCVKPYQQAAMRGAPSAQNSSREKLE